MPHQRSEPPIGPSSVALALDHCYAAVVATLYFLVFLCVDLMTLFTRLCRLQMMGLGPRLYWILNTNKSLGDSETIKGENREKRSWTCMGHVKILCLALTLTMLSSIVVINQVLLLPPRCLSCHILPPYPQRLLRQCCHQLRDRPQPHHNDRLMAMAMCSYRSRRLSTLRPWVSHHHLPERHLRGSTM